MKKWTRWQDWAALLAGAYAALAPLWTETTTRATWTMVALGVLTAAVSLWSLATPDDRNSEIAHVVLGALFVISPWVMGFSDMMPMAWTAWIVGAVAIIAGGLALPESNRLHREHHAVAH
ncbi:SPW repeat protein [Ornithinimicrobium cavernae]|uniref:SPW repeat protein n=1 Tax=Ornithinimicrobium cavernae TaxID=2666047 RepID=UPI000D68F82F|nr:SPW repeat protein [Ornithinimicrobium cavernae]